VSRALRALRAPPIPLLLLLLFLPGLGSVAARAGDGAAGRAKAEPCLQCHGTDGVSRLEGVPSLAGQPAYYLQLQLLLFRDRQREVASMSPFAEGLSDADTEDLAGFFASLPPPAPANGTDAARIARGRAVAATHHCGSCHLADFRGREQMARLATQREDYLVKAMRDFKANLRAGTDGTMAEVLFPLSDDDLADLAAFLAQAGATP
jgi:cytochrome c553